jgi:hypothetical protein
MYLYQRLKYRYDSGDIDKDKLRIAVSKGWISDVEFEEITGEVY